MTSTRQYLPRRFAKICGWLKVGGAEARSLGNPRKHPRADFFFLMKRKSVIAPTGAGQYTVRSCRFSLNRPADSQEGGQDESGFACRPVGHADTANSSSSAGIASP
jgi:hypothetical protein